MDSVEDYHFQIHNSHLFIKALIFSLAIYILIAPFTGLFPLQGNLIVYFKDNLNGFQGLPLNINPIFLTIEILMYQIELLLEYLFPLFWGTNNYFFLRFILKLPLFIFFFLDAVLVKKIIQLEYNDSVISNFAFTIQLLNLPLIYTSFILGTSESFAFFLFLASYLFMIQVLKKKIPENENFLNIFIAGFLLGLAISFSIWFLFVFFLFLRHLNVRKLIFYSLSIGVSVLLVFIPYYFIFNTSFINYTPDTFGIGIFLQYIGLNALAPILLLIELALLLFISIFLKIEDNSKLIIISAIVIILSPYLTINEFIIFLEIFILGLIKYSKSEKVVTIEENRKVTLPSSGITVLLVILYLVFLVYILFIYPIFNVFYINIIELGFIGRTNLSFWQSNAIIEFKSLSFIIFSIIVTFGLFIVQRKGKIFNTNKNYSTN